MTDVEKEQEKSSNMGAMIALAAAFGGIIGATAGILFAPQAGKDSREQFKKAYDAMVDNVHEFVKSFDEHVPKLIAKLRDEVRDIPEHVKLDIQNITKETDTILNNVLDKGTSYVSDMNKSIVASLEEGRKKFKEVSDRLSKN